jgi:hypothetical protein
MERDRKITNQGTGKDENRVDNIMPDTWGSRPAAGRHQCWRFSRHARRRPERRQRSDRRHSRRPGAINDDSKSKTDRLHNNNTTNDYLNEVDVNMGGVPLEKSPGATNEGNNPSNPETAAARMNTANDLTDDREAGCPPGGLRTPKNKPAAPREPSTLRRRHHLRPGPRQQPRQRVRRADGVSL